MWVLIILYSVHYGTGVSFQEFSSQQMCISASQKILEMKHDVTVSSDSYLSMRCVPK